MALTGAAGGAGRAIARGGGIGSGSGRRVFLTTFLGFGGEGFGLSTLGGAGAAGFAGPVPFLPPSGLGATEVRQMASTCTTFLLDGFRGGSIRVK
ncbi:MAG: hypothetical protein ACOZF2_18535 [Thermodesulfobacteriota bacterium]